MKASSNLARIGIAAAIIAGTIVWLAWSGYGASKSYYVTIAELGGMGDKAYHSHLRVEGFVVPGSIEQDGPHVSFVLNEFESHSPKAASGRLLRVSYKGSEPPPDTFKDDAQALADGSYGRDGLFHATVLQAKCASKYAPVQPSSQPSSQSNSAQSGPTRPNSMQPKSRQTRPMQSTSFQPHAAPTQPSTVGPRAAAPAAAHHASSPAAAAPAAAN
jgi:cytochrome c-type biogenesis protein CcmE